MKKHLLHFIFAALFIVLFVVPTWALQPPTGGPKVYGYGMWHEQYFLFAARVEDPLISGTSTEPQVYPTNDDGIELAFSLPTAQGSRVTSRLIVSVAGGFTVLTKDETGRWKTDNSWLQPPAVIKLATEVDGTLNKPGDTDRAFTIEVAIPWERLGGTPKTMNILTNSFNFGVRVRGENQAFVSWSPVVASEEENEDPARWGGVLFYPGNRPSQSEPGAFVCPHVFRVPLIDGRLGMQEWIGASILTLHKPVPEFKPTPEAERTRDEFPQVMALYRFDYRNGKPSGGTPLLQQPMNGGGLIMSAHRPGWHREQFPAMQQAGIEVLLPMYPASPSAQAEWAHQGLAALTTALKEQRTAERYYPLIGMYLDLSSLKGAGTAPVDLMEGNSQKMVSDAIRAFYRQVAPEYRLDTGAIGEQKAYLVVLGPPIGITRWDKTFLTFAEKEFEHEFGARLQWMVDPAWKEQGLTDLYAYAPLSGFQSTANDATGNASVAVISPGYADFNAGVLRPFGEGPELREAWRQVLALNPDYLIVNSWNNFVRGTSVAPTRQFGFTLIDTLSLLISQETAKVKQPVRLKKVNIPASVAPGGKTQIEILLTNTSPETITTNQHINFDMRVLDKKTKLVVVSKNDVAPMHITPGGSIRLTIPFQAVDTNRRSLPPGEYLVEFNLQRSPLAYIKTAWLMKKLASFQLPLRVVRPPEYAVSVLNSTLHTQMKGGARYVVSLELRNDGSKKWRKKDTHIGHRWYRYYNEASATEDLGDGSLTTPLPKDVAPGEVIVLPVSIETSAAGRALAEGASNVPHLYGFAWTLLIGNKAAATTQGAGLETVQIYDEDLGGRFVDSTTPREMITGQEYQTKLVLQNTGAEAWLAGATAISYRWLYWDGAPTSWEGTPTPLPAAIRPGDSAQITATVTAPPDTGAYVLVWELQCGGKSSLTSPNTNGDGMLAVPVMVQGGPYYSLDLSQFGNVVISASERRRSSADFDGLGNSLPLECMPPDLSGNATSLYPSGYYASVDDSTAYLRNIPFRYPEKNNSLSKAVACQGQTIPVDNVTAAKIHVLGAGTGAGLSGDVAVTFADGSQTVPLTMSSWLESPSHGETIALMVPYIRTSREDNLRQAGYLHHYVLTLSAPAAVTSLSLPVNPEMKIVAITLESPKE